ncbi:MAG: hypothetical protein LBV38_07765, partial [Alistipes sp.]|nr:hypothetical protein [Alistipes sp.]
FGQTADSVQISVSEQTPLIEQSTGELTIKGNRRYYIDQTQITRDEALAIVAPYPDVVKLMKRGVTMKRVAIGFGISGPLITYVGFIGVIFSALGGGQTTPYAVMLGVGGAMTYTAIGLAIGSGGSRRKAMRLYNGYIDSGDYGDLSPNHNTVYLSLAPTSGGLSLQLTF